MSGRLCRVLATCYCSFVPLSKDFLASSVICSAGLFGCQLFPRPSDAVTTGHHSIYFSLPVLCCSWWSSQLQWLPSTCTDKFLWLSSTKCESGFKHKRVRESAATKGHTIRASILRPNPDCSTSLSGGRTSVLSVPLAILQHSWLNWQQPTGLIDWNRFWVLCTMKTFDGTWLLKFLVLHVKIVFCVYCKCLLWGLIIEKHIRWPPPKASHIPHSPGKTVLFIWEHWFPSSPQIYAP